MSTPFDATWLERNYVLDKPMELCAMTTTVRKGQVTIPAALRRAAHIEDGDPMEVELVEEGLLLRPKKIVDANQAWFWTDAWQEKVRQGLAELEADEAVTFGSDDKFFEALDQ